MGNMTKDKNNILLHKYNYSNDSAYVNYLILDGATIDSHLISLNQNKINKFVEYITTQVYIA
jgi:hypothetical protein